jgi:regulator of sirC expression with transglutaminase-like and TPR domain
MLRNLKEIHRSNEDWPRLLGVLDRLVILLPSAWEERRDRGLAAAELGAVQPAVADLSAYLEHAPQAPDRIAIAERLVELGHGDPSRFH